MAVPVGRRGLTLGHWPRAKCVLFSNVFIAIGYGHCFEANAYGCPFPLGLGAYLYP